MDGGNNPTKSVKRALEPLYGVFDPLRLVDKPAPERKWIVPGWIPDLAISVFSGHGGLGKSLVALQLAVACETQTKWLGMTVKPCHVLYISAEDDQDELHRRLIDVLRAAGKSLEDLESFTPVDRVDQDNALVAYDRWGQGEETPLYWQIHDKALTVGAGLIVLDSRHNLFTGNENDRAVVYDFMRRLRQLARQTGCAVLLIDHPSRDGLKTGSGDAGSTGWHNSARGRFYLSKSEGEHKDVRRLEAKKSNYAAMGDAVTIRWHDGAFIRADQPGIFGAILRQTAETVFLTLLRATIAEGRAVSDSRNAGNFAPRVFAGRPDKQGFNKSDFAKAMESLFASGRIRVVEYGRTSDLRSKIVPVDERRE
jgi:RecA-family ATPase